MIITFITTVDHNVGDDFVREGIKYIIKQVLKRTDLHFQNIHKHSPITVRHGFEWFKNVSISKFVFPSEKLDVLLPLSITRDKILEADLVIQSGAPVYWCHKDHGSHCADNEWFDVLIRRRFLSNKKAKLLNIAAGSCQEFTSDGTEFLQCSKDIEYIKEFYSISDLTTVRDTLAQKILAQIGLNAQIIPCPSIFAVDEYGFKPEEKKYLIINYMKTAGHYTFSRKIDSDKWFNELKLFYNYVKNKEEVLFVCHNKQEVSEAKKIDPGANIFFSNDFLEFMKVYSYAKYGVMNRVHGAFLMASYGAPSFIIGNDSRARMASEIGLDSMFINDVNSDILIDKYEGLKTYQSEYQSKFDKVKTKAFNDYYSLLSTVLKDY